MAFSTETYFARAPITSASSTSQSVFSPPIGRRRSSSGPASALVAFMNTIGSVGSAAPLSRAWSR